MNFGRQAIIIQLPVRIWYSYYLTSGTGSLLMKKKQKQFDANGRFVKSLKVP